MTSRALYYAKQAAIRTAEGTRVVALKDAERLAAQPTAAVALKAVPRPSLVNAYGYPVSSAKPSVKPPFWQYTRNAETLKPIALLNNGRVGLPFLGTDINKLMDLLKQREAVTRNIRDTPLKAILEVAFGIEIPDDVDIDHNSPLWLLLGALRNTAEANLLTPELANATRHIGNNHNNLSVISGPLNKALDKQRRGHRIKKIGTHTISENGMRLTLNQLMNEAYGLGYRVYIRGPDSYVPVEEVGRAIELLSVSPINFAETFDLNIQNFPGINPQNSIGLRRLSQEVRNGIDRMLNQRQLGGVIYPSSITPIIQQKLIEYISNLIELYLGDTNFTYESYFDGKYFGKNPIPKKEQSLEDAKFTIFLLKLLNKLSRGNFESASTDLEILYNKFPPELQNSTFPGASPRGIRNNGRNYIHRELALGHLFGGTRKLKRFKKTRKALRPRKRKTRRGLKA